MPSPRASDDVREFIESWPGRSVGIAFRDLYFDWYPREDVLSVEIHSQYGTTTRLDMGYPLDLDLVKATAQRHVDADRERCRMADRLVAETWADSNTRAAGHQPYILRWLVHTQDVHVTFGDAPDIEPAVRSPSTALISTAEHAFKVWSDGAAVLHFSESGDRSAGGRESRGMDLAQMSLREFQDMWLPVRAEQTGDTSAVLAALPPTSAQAAAVRLLVEYDDGSWLRHHLFREVVLPSEASSVNWLAANRLSVTHTEATIQDRAVLAVACHLADAVEPLVCLPDALHYVGSARWDVLKALDSVTGRHPNPAREWPTDCPSCP